MQASALLLHWRSYCRARNLRVLIVYLFIFSLLCCPLCFQSSAQIRQWEGFLVFGNFSLFKTPIPGQNSVSPSFVSFFVFYIFSYLLSKTWLAFLGAWCPLPGFRSCFVEFTRRLNALLMNLLGRKCSPRPTPLRHLGSSPGYFYLWSTSNGSHWWYQTFDLNPVPLWNLHPWTSSIPPWRFISIASYHETQPPGRAVKSRVAQEKHKTQLTLFSVSHFWYALNLFYSSSNWLHKAKEPVLLMRKWKKATCVDEETKETESGIMCSSGVVWST